MNPHPTYGVASQPKTTRGIIPVAVRRAWEAVDRHFDGAGGIKSWEQIGEIPDSNAADGWVSHVTVMMSLDYDGSAWATVKVVSGEKRTYEVTGLSVNGKEVPVPKKAN